MVFPRLIFELDAVDVNAHMAVSVVDQSAVNQFGTDILPDTPLESRTPFLDRCGSSATAPGVALPPASMQSFLTGSYGSREHGYYRCIRTEGLEVQQGLPR